MGYYFGKFGFAVCDVRGCNYADQSADAFHKSNPAVPVMASSAAT
jgi:hypothetical protein